MYCFSQGEPDISCPDFGLCCFDGCANRCIRCAQRITKTIQFCQMQVGRLFQSYDIEWYFCCRLRKEAGSLSSDQKALSSQDNGENAKVCQSTNFTDYLNAIIIVPVIPSGRAKYPANDSSSRCLGTKASIRRTHILTSPSRAQSALAD